MSWSMGWDGSRDRWIGYGVPATCDHPKCKKKIDRGLSYVCAEQQPYGGENGCGLYFCEKHADGYGFCERCEYNQEVYDEEKGNWQDMKSPFEAKPERKIWLKHILNHSSWQGWREENPRIVKNYKKQLEETK